MKIIDETGKQTSRPITNSRNVFLGTTFVAVGSIWLLYNFDLLSEAVFDTIFSWQMLLVVIGGYLLSVRRWTAGAIAAGVGLCFMATDLLGIRIPVGKVLMPVIFIAIGLSVLFAHKRL